ncbi:MAG: 50S ribosomal protein L9 [Ileibacterium sp.]|nr:50S ribosomal protein L9 [Ileibacterium sp.]
MKVILLEDVKKVGKKDEVIEVADGYAKNFLIKTGKAEPCNKENTRALDERRQEKAEHEAALKAQAEETKKVLDDLVLEFTLNTSKNGQTFGQISSKQIAQALAAKGLQVDKRKIMMDVPADSLGTTKVKADLYKGQVIATINVHISAKDS